MGNLQSMFKCECISNIYQANTLSNANAFNFVANAWATFKAFSNANASPVIVKPIHCQMRMHRQHYQMQIHCQMRMHRQ